MSVKGFTNTTTDGLIFSVDAYNRKSYVSGNTVTSDLVTNDFGKFDLSWVGPNPRVTDIHNDLIFLSDDRNLRQSIYNTSTDTSYKFGSDALYNGGGYFDTTEIVNGLPVIYGCGFNPANAAGRFNDYIKRYEYQGSDTWSNTFTLTLTDKAWGKLNANLYNSTNGRSDLWLASSEYSTAVDLLTLYQWNGSAYDEYDFTSIMSPYVPFLNKFIYSAVPVSSGRIFLTTASYTNQLSSRQVAIVEMLFTGSTYSDPNDWSLSVIAGKITNGWGDVDGELGTNTLAIAPGDPSPKYNGELLNGEPRLFFHNVYQTNYGNSQNESSIRELFWNGSAWEVTTHLTTTDTLRSGVINSDNDKFYTINLTTQKLDYLDLNTNQITGVTNSLTNSIEDERTPKTIDLINGVGFDGKTWTFDGVNDYISIGDFFDMGTDSMTIDCWISVNQTLTQPGQIYTKAIADDTPYRYFFNVQTTSPRTGKIRAGFQGNQIGAFVADGTTDLRGLGWVNVTIVWERTSTLRVYVNSELEGSIDISSKSSDNLQSNFESFIGMVPDSGGITPSLFFNGDISNLKIYRRVLIDQEIKQNYNGLKWRFNQ